MPELHRATPEQWANMKEYQDDGLDDGYGSCIIELRDRVEALEAAQLEQAESNRFCVDAIVRRVEALEATQHAHADVSHLNDADRERVTQELAKPAAWRPLETEITYCTEAAIATAQQIQAGTMDELQAALVGLRDRAPGSLKSTIYARFELDPKHDASATASDEPISMATAQQILRAPITVEGTFEHGGETYRFKAKPEPADAMSELPAASAEVRPSGLAERDPECVANWPDCYEGGYDPSCCRFPKSCSCEVRRLFPAASAEARPTVKDSLTDGGGLVERVARSIERTVDFNPDSYAPEARAAIREVAAWLRDRYPKSPEAGAVAFNLCQEADRG